MLREIGSPDDFGNPPIPLTGKLTVRSKSPAREGAVFLRAGRAYSTDLEGFVPPVAKRMFSGGMISPETFAYLSTLAPEKIGPEAIDAGYASSDEIEDIHRQMMLSTLTHIYAWNDADWWWEEKADTQNFIISGLETGLLVTAADERIGQWSALQRNFPTATKGHAVPQPGPSWGAKAGESTTPEIVSILTHVNGSTNISQIATECGFTRFEIAARVAKAIADGILILPDPDGEVVPDPNKDTFGASEGVNVHQFEVEEAQSEVDRLTEALRLATARLERAKNSVPA